MMQETTLNNIKAKLRQLGFAEVDIEKGVADAIEGSKKADAVYFHKKGYRDTVIQMQKVSECSAGSCRKVRRVGSRIYDMAATTGVLQ